MVLLFYSIAYIHQRMSLVLNTVSGKVSHMNAAITMSPSVLYEGNKIQILQILQYLCTCRLEWKYQIPYSCEGCNSCHHRPSCNCMCIYASQEEEIMYTLWKLKLSLRRVFSLNCDFTHWILLDASMKAVLTNQGSALGSLEKLSMVFNNPLLSVKYLLSLCNGA